MKRNYLHIKRGIKVYYLDRFPCDTNVILTLVGAVPDHAKKMNLAAYISGCFSQMIITKKFWFSKMKQHIYLRWYRVDTCPSFPGKASGTA